MTTHLPHWSKLSFHKKSKLGPEGGSPKNSRKTRSTIELPEREEEDGSRREGDETSDNNNKENMLESDLDKKLDLESKFSFYFRTMFVPVGKYRVTHKG